MATDDFFEALKREINHKPAPSSVGPKPIGDKEVRERLAEIDAQAKEVIAEEPIWMPELPTELPVAKADIVAGHISLSEQQKNNACIIAYSLGSRNLTIEPPAIYHLWPVEGDPYKLQRAGKRPSITALQQFMATDDFSFRMGERGIAIAPQTGLMPEQIALISILADTTSRLGFNARLKRAGITWAVYSGWRKQKPFADALSQAQGGALSDAVGNADVQLAQMAQNGDLKSIIYMNEMIGRGPNNRKAVDAIAFARIVLEAVQKHVNTDQAKAISAEIELASKQLGIGA